MKKTLITLAALAMASVASATELTDMTYFDLSETASARFAQDGTASYSFTMVLDWAAITDGSTIGTTESTRTNVLNSGLNNTGSPWWLNGIKAYYDQTRQTLNLNIHVDNTAKFDGVTGSEGATVSNGTLVLTMAGYNYGDFGKLGLTYTFDAATDTATIYALNTNGGVDSISVVTNSAWSQNATDDIAANVSGVEHLWGMTGVIAPTDVAGISTKAVPEPTTATLSLLALAGLAARRRRK